MKSSILNFKLFSSIFMLCLLWSCSSDPTPPSEPAKSSEKKITSFKLEASQNPILKDTNIGDLTGQIDEAKKTISIEVTLPLNAPPDIINAFLKAAVASFEVSAKATVTVNNTEQKSTKANNDFTKDVVYTVIAEDKTTVDYTVKVTVKARPKTAYVPTVIPADVTKLIKKISAGTQADAVLLIAQGGPFPALESASETKGLVGETLINKYETYLVHQAQTYNPGMNNSDITFEQAKVEAAKSSAMLQKVIEHFKGQNKKVYIWGFSYGFFVIEDLLARYEMKFDRAFLGGGRFNMPEKVWQTFSKGRNIGFEADAVTINQTSDPDGTIAFFSAALGQNRYTELLKDKDLAKNILFYFGGKDRAVGRLDKDELQFLKDKKTLHIFDEKIGHAISPENYKKIFKFISEGVIK